MVRISAGVSPRRCASLVCAILTLSLLTPADAAAQYFGRNKVQYRTFDFEVLRTEHFDVYFYDEEREGAALAARMAERWRARLGEVLRHELSGRQPLILYAAQPHFQQTNVIGGEIGESTGGVTEGLRRRIVMPLGGPLANTDHVIGHELVHAYQYDITAARDAGGQGAFPGVARLPLWFVEGMAEYLSIGPFDPHTAMWMRDAVFSERLPSIKDLDRGDYFPYRWGHAFWAYIAGRYGDPMVGRLLREASRAGSPIVALEAELGLKSEELSEAWHAELRRMAEQVPGTAPASQFGELLTGPRALGGELNVAPSLSPDGRRVAFLSERDLFSIDLYIADTETGEILTRVSRTGVDPHFTSLQFINSAGGWSASGERFAFAAITAGRAALAIYDVQRREVAREIPLEGVDEAFNPTWSPDGRRIAFAGMTGGLTDLFVVDVESGAVTRLTEDVFAVIHPAWSPDGRRIAFATDRFTTNVDALAIGELRLGIIDAAGGQVQPVPGFEGAKHMNPQWAPDGAALYFLSDRGGITNVYRVDLASRQLRQATNLQTGISGITAASPALSVAQGSGRLAFSAYEGGHHRIYTTTSDQVLAGVPPRDLPGAPAALLPPPVRRDGDLVAMLRTPAQGLPPGPPTQPPGQVEDYNARLGLEMIGQPTIGIGRDRFGTFGSGGVAFRLSDMLGDHTVGAIVQLNTSFTSDTSLKDIGASVGYTNMKRRWNWGGYVEQVPYRTGGFGVATGVIGGEPVVIEQSVLFRQTSRAVGGAVAYPFSQAQRMEFTGGYRNLTFDQDARVTVYSQLTGRVIADERSREQFGEPLHLADAAAALVYDTSVFGATSPVLGQRYRLEVSPVTGSLGFTSVLADYRRYFMPVQFYTLAARVLHYGRYGGDAEDSRLTPLFIGYPTLVRGYDVGSFTAEDCGNSTDGSCPAFDRLLGSRALVANVELRFPLLRPFGVRRGLYGPLPVEVALFADGGVAWDSRTSPEIFGGDRQAVGSAGVGFRVNAMGFTVLQFDVVRPFNRVRDGWRFQFSLSPGF